jgi:hypothetical protein
MVSNSRALSTLDGLQAAETGLRPRVPIRILPFVRRGTVPSRQTETTATWPSGRGVPRSEELAGDRRRESKSSANS